MGMMGNGCQNCAVTTGLDGVWAFQRGDVEVTFTFTTGSNGAQEQTIKKTTLDPLDPADFPAELADFVNEWNNNLAAVNLALDAALPDSLIITFPQCPVIRLIDPNDAANTADGIIGAMLNYVFITPLVGGGQSDPNGGGGLILSVASVEGSFDALALTTTGQIIRKLAVIAGNGNNSGAAFGVEIAVNYTGNRTGDAP